LVFCITECNNTLQRLITISLVTHLYLEATFNVQVYRSQLHGPNMSQMATQCN